MKRALFGKKTVFFSIFFALWLLVMKGTEGRAGFPEDLFRGIGNVAGSIASIPGGILGDVFGAASAPTIHNLEGSGHNLISDLDSRLGRRIAELDEARQKAVADLDYRLEKRLMQLDEVAAKRIDQIDEVVKGSIKALDETTQKRIKQVDDMLKDRVEQVDEVLHKSLDGIDRLLTEKLDKLDEITARRVGNLDIIATKATLSLEQAMVRFVAAACLMIFSACALWCIYQVAYKNTPSRGTLLGWIRHVGWPLTWQIGATALGLFLLFWIFQRIPSNARFELDQLQTNHEIAFRTSLENFDFREASYHATQLQFLSPAKPLYRALLQKTYVMRDLFTRPALRANLAGINDLVWRIQQVNDLFQKDTDYDLEVMKAFLYWQSGPTRLHEFHSAKHCAQALTEYLALSESAQASVSFPLFPLAVNYLENYLFNPLTDEFVKQMTEETEFRSIKDLRGAWENAKTKASKRPSDNHFASLLHIFKYNIAARELNAVSMNHYSQMVLAHANWLASEPEQRKAFADARNGHAKEVIGAWRKFDTLLAEDPVLIGTTVPLAVFGLNDAIFTRAKWYEKNDVFKNSLFEEITRAKLLQVAPAISQSFVVVVVSGDKKTEEFEASKRALLTPPRIVWANRYLPTLKKGSLMALKSLFTDFVTNEKQLMDFEVKMAVLVRALKGKAERDGLVKVQETMELAAGLKLVTYEKLIDAQTPPAKVSPFAEQIAVLAVGADTSGTVKRALDKFRKEVLFKRYAVRGLLTL